MTVATELAYAERQWTGVETSFTPGFPALAIADVVVKFKSAENVITTLTRGVHFNVTLGVANAVTITPIVLPPAPGTLLISRRTPALVSVVFDDLEDFPASEHQTLADAAALRDAEIWDYVGRFVIPWTNLGGVIDFGAYRLAGAAPLVDGEFATRGYVLEVTGLLGLQASVDAAAASATSAATSAGAASTAKIGAEAARDLAQLWASNGHLVVVSGGLFSARSYAIDAQNSATAAATSAQALANPDYGFIAEAPTETRDYGSIA